MSVEISNANSKDIQTHFKLRLNKRKPVAAKPTFLIKNEFYLSNVSKLLLNILLRCYCTHNTHVFCRIIE